MSYHAALEAAGAAVSQFKEFGSYQGDWWARVEYQGKAGWVTGSYGSCSGCDAFEADIGYVEDETNPSYRKRLADFGAGYLETILLQDEAVSKASENLAWDLDAGPMVAFIKENAVPS